MNAEMYTVILPLRYSDRRSVERALRNILGSSDFYIESFFYEQWTVKVPRLFTKEEVELIIEYARTYSRVGRENNAIRERVKGWSKSKAKNTSQGREGTNFAPPTTQYSTEEGIFSRSNEPDTRETSATQQDLEEKIDLPQLSSFSTSFPINVDVKPQQSHIIYVELGPEKSDQTITRGLYAEQLESGETSQVFNIIASSSPLVNDKAPDRGKRKTLKIAIKRLHKTASIKQFGAELHSLRSMNTLRHPNIVKTLSVFKYEENTDSYLNFAFPLARGNLKRLFRGSYNDDYVLQRTAQTALWNQFLGLASALAHMHGKANIAHRDIKPSNILIYEEPGDLVLKITDFGLSIDLSEALTWEIGTLDLQSAWLYDSPELRQRSKVSELDKVKVPTPKELLSNDVWKLGCVFTELLAYLVGGGSSGVFSFRNHITTTEGNMSSDFFNDTRFDDGERLKPQVHEWLDKAARKDNRVKILQPTIQKMLAPLSERPSSEEICMEIVESNLSGTRYNDGIRVVQFIPGLNLKPPTAINRLKLKLETWLDCPIDWRPFHGTSRLCSANQTLINWTVATHQLSLVLSRDEMARYKPTCVPILQSGTPVLPRWETGNSQQPRSTEHELDNLTRPSSTRSEGQSENIKPVVIGGTDTQQLALSSQDVYWCNDKVYTEPLQTILYEINNWDALHSDKEFYELVNCLTRHIKGWRLSGWLFSVLSWKRCTQVDFVKFHVVANNRNQVLPGSQDLPPPTQIEYEHGVLEPVDIHIRLASLEIVEGLINPRIGNDKKDIIQLLPRKRNPPSLGRKRGVEGWGLHARMGFSVHKICRWIVICFLIVVIFVVVWLVYISPTDLQNAFAPAFFVTSLLTLGLAVVQSLEK
ncbi:kinase-like domain-containing protein [Xylaria sp. FL1042]|nr:kinase-like domain-containing protein [Xylaria sp. FL1042]